MGAKATGKDVSTLTVKGTKTVVTINKVTSSQCCKYSIHWSCIHYGCNHCCSCCHWTLSSKIIQNPLPCLFFELSVSFFIENRKEMHHIYYYPSLKKCNTSIKKIKRAQQRKFHLSLLECSLFFFSQKYL